jgi:hypothetical protein
MVIYSHAANAADVSEKAGRRRVGTVEAFVRSNGKVEIKSFTFPRTVKRFSLWFKNPITGEEAFFMRGEVDG